MMKTPLLIATILTAAGLMGAGADETPRAILREALFAEEAEGDLDAAATGYEALIAGYDAQREFAVAALYRLAEVRRKQERNDDAARLYQRILAEFPQADPQARLSTENLTAMGVELAAGPGKSDKPSPEEENELRRLGMLAENSPERIWENAPLGKAAEQNWQSVMVWLFERAAADKRDIAEEVTKALRSAARLGQRDMCELLLRNGAAIEEMHGELAHAILHDLDPIAEWLIENGASINGLARGKINAIYGAQYERFTYPQRSKGIDSEPYSAWGRLSPLAAAIVTDDKFWVDRLLELDVDMNATADVNGAMSALAVACWKGHAPLVQKLLDRGADPSKPETLIESPSLIRQPSTRGAGWTPLHYGAGDSQIVSALLDAGADATAEDSLGVTPLHCACFVGDLESVRQLLEAGAAPGAFATLQRDHWGTRSPKAYHFNPLMIASLHADPAASRAMVESLVEAGADPFAENGGAEDVFSVCSVPENLQFLTETYLYPKQVTDQQIAIAFPEAGSFETLATREEAQGDAVPRFAKALSEWNGEASMRFSPVVSSTKKVVWRSPVLRRRGGDGKFSSIPIDLLDEASYPELQWGDVVEFRLSSRRGSSSTMASTPLGYILMRSSAPPRTETMPRSIRRELRASIKKPITLEMAGKPPREVNVDGGLVVVSPFGSLPERQYHELLKGLGYWGSAVLTRSAELGGARLTHDSDLRFAMPEAGDHLAFEPEIRSKNAVVLVEPETGTEIFRVNPERQAPEPDSGLEQLPTLFQFITSAYPTFDRHERQNRLTERREQVLRRAFDPRQAEEEDEAPPTEQELVDAVGGLARDIVIEQRYLLPHPDFSKVRIRRQRADAEDEVIEISIAAFIAECTPETPAAECRAKDVQLQAGDLVELTDLGDRRGQPWSGFDEATARFFEKALTYELKLVNKKGETSTETVGWKAPDAYNTEAGIVLLREWLAPASMQADDVFLATTFRGEKAPHFAGSLWVRHGATIDFKKRLRSLLPPNR